MQGKDPFLALLGLFILGTTFFFCGKGLVPLPPPVALENPPTILSPAPNIFESPVSPPSVPLVSVPVGLNKTIDERLIERSMLSRIHGVPLLLEGEILLNSVAAMVHEDPTLALEVGGHTQNTGVGHKHEVLLEPRAHTDVAFLLSRGIAVEQLVSKGARVPRPVVESPADEGRWKNRGIESVIRAEGEQP